MENEEYENENTNNDIIESNTNVDNNNSSNEEENKKTITGGLKSGLVLCFSGSIVSLIVLVLYLIVFLVAGTLFGAESGSVAETGLIILLIAFILGIGMIPGILILVFSSKALFKDYFKHKGLANACGILGIVFGALTFFGIFFSLSILLLLANLAIAVLYLVGGILILVNKNKKENQ